MTSGHHIRWGRVIVAGVLIELAMLSIFIPVNLFNERSAYYLVPFLAIATAFGFGRWAARPLHGQFVLHGVLAAAVASLIYIVMTTAAGASVPLLFHASNAVRLLAGAAGGAYAGRQARSIPVGAPVTS